MNIKEESKTLATSIIEWCHGVFRSEEGNFPSHAIERLMKRQKKEIIDKACEWLRVHSMVDYEIFRKAMMEE